MNYPRKLLYGQFEFEFRNSPLDPGMKSYILKNINNYEAGERLLIEKIIKKGDRILEAGTSTGILTGLISTLVGQSGQVVTVEADHKLVEIAKSINKSNTNIKFLSGAIVFDDRKKLYFSTDGWLGGHISSSYDGKKKNIIEVPAHNLYELINKNEINFIVLDIEGEESNLVSLNLPLSVTKIVIEFHPDIYGSSLVEQLDNRIIEQGFKSTGSYENVFAYIRG